MPTSLPMPTKAAGDIFTPALWNSYLRDNMNKLLNLGHRTLTVAQFAALATPEGTKGVVAGDEVYLEVDAANGILWHLVYESTETTYKWRYLGGPELSTEVLTSETTTSTAYAALTTAGPAITLSRGGDYDVEIGFTMNVGNSSVAELMSYDVGATPAVDADACWGNVPAQGGSFARQRRKTAIAAATTLTAKYRVPAGTGAFANRWMRIRPARIL